MNIILDQNTTGLLPAVDKPAANYGIIVTDADVDLLSVQGFFFSVMVRYRHQWGENIVLVPGQYLLVSAGNQWTLVYEGKDGRPAKLDPRQAVELLTLEGEQDDLARIASGRTKEPTYALALFILWRTRNARR